MSKTKRTGVSLKHTAADCPKAVYLALGFSEEQARRMMAVRRILPFVDNRRKPIIDARKLWTMIGEPHGRFRDWADFYIRPLQEASGINAEISAKFIQSGKRGRPSQEFDLSRDLAAQLAMMANTKEGQKVREYFLDMEEAITRLARHQPIRANLLIQADNALTHTARIQAGNASKDGLIPRSFVSSVSLSYEKRIKSLVCQILTGYSTSEWREAVGKSIRDSLCTSDLETYSRCYDMAVSLFRAGCGKDDVLINMLAPTFGSSIKIDDYTECATG